jgi:cytosine/adenosine deaminase-related metal-dependent hydrolase
MHSSSSTIIRGGTVVTSADADPTTDGPADVLIRDGRIAAVGLGLAVPAGAAVIDARGKVVLPGLVDTHRHVWQSALGGVGNRVSLGGYFGTVIAGMAPRYTPEDVYAGVLWGALQALDAGITTIVDWSHIVTTPEHADANVAGLHDAGIRGLFLYGPPVAAGLVEWFVDSDLPHPADARRMRAEHFAGGTNGRMRMGLALRGPELSTLAATLGDFDLARELDLPVSLHCGFAGSARVRTATVLAEHGLLGPGVNLVHANLLTDDELALVADHGASISACPSVDMLMALGTHPAVGKALEHGATVGLGVDTIAGAGTDLFSEMRVALAAERSRANAAAVARDEAVAEVALDQRDMLRLSTTAAAATFGLEDEIGRLEPGKAADVILVDVDAPHLQPLNDPVTRIVLGAGPRDVDTVLVAGEVVKRGGRLVGRHAARARALVEASAERLAHAPAVA